MQIGENRMYDAYLWHRQHGYKAKDAIVRAHEDIIADKKRYPHHVGYKYGGNWQRIEVMDKWSSPHDRAYYCDNFPSGWRDHGSAYEVCRREHSRRVDHQGWYTDDFQSDTLRGYVLQIPSRHGVPQYVPATKASGWDGVTLYPLDRYDDILDCAAAADHIAEKDAEREREYKDFIERTINKIVAPLTREMAGVTDIKYVPASTD
jgi:hypothetical protein